MWRRVLCTNSALEGMCVCEYRSRLFFFFFGPLRWRGQTKWQATSGARSAIPFDKLSRLDGKEARKSLTVTFFRRRSVEIVLFSDLPQIISGVAGMPL